MAYSVQLLFLNMVSGVLHRAQLTSEVRGSTVTFGGLRLFVKRFQNSLYTMETDKHNKYYSLEWLSHISLKILLFMFPVYTIDRAYL